MSPEDIKSQKQPPATLCNATNFYIEQNSDAVTMDEQERLREVWPKLTQEEKKRKILQLTMGYRWLARQHRLMKFLGRKPEFREEFYTLILVYASSNAWRYKPKEGGFTVSQLAKVATDLGVGNFFKKSRTAYSVYGRLEAEKRYVICTTSVEKGREVKRFSVSESNDVHDWLRIGIKSLFEHMMIVEGLESLPTALDYLTFLGYRAASEEHLSKFQRWIIDEEECPECSRRHAEQYFWSVIRVGTEAIEQFQEETGLLIERLGEF